MDPPVHIFFSTIQGNKKAVTFKHVSTTNTHLLGEYDSCSCVLSTGRIAVFDKDVNEGNWKFCLFNSEGTVIEDKANALCEHGGKGNRNNYKLLPIIFSNIEYIVVSCSLCCMIRLINPEDLNREPVMACTEYWGPMCLVDTHTICIVSRSQVFLLDCTTTKFGLKRILCNTDGFCPDNICYIEDLDLIVLSSWAPCRICAVIIKDGQVVWDKSKQVLNHRTLQPKGLTFLHDPCVLIAGDRKGNIVMLSPKTGDILQTIPLLSETIEINDFHLIIDKVLVHHQKHLSFFLVSYVLYLHQILFYTIIIIKNVSMFK